MQYLVMFFIALLITSIGFRKYNWFFGIGYGFTIAAVGLAMLAFFRRYMSNLILCICLLLFVYGVRLGVYLIIREFQMSSYIEAMKKRAGPNHGIVMKIVTWLSCSLIYTLQVSPVLFRLSNGGTTDIMTVVGAVIMVCGIVLETVSDLQKSLAKKKDPERFVSTGLYGIVRCPNYLGEIIFWTGVFLSGVTALRGPVQWLFAVAGYVIIVYTMFSGARRLELRQNDKYGENPQYQRYVKRVPILLPFIPLYSLVPFSFLAG